MCAVHDMSYNITRASRAHEQIPSIVPQNDTPPRVDSECDLEPYSYRCCSALLYSVRPVNA